MVPEHMNGRIARGVPVLAVAAGVFLTNGAFAQNTRDIVHGNLVQFNDNGAWSWFQDERCVVDPGGGKIILGSDGGGSGTGGAPRSGDVESVIFDLLTRTSQRTTLREGDPSVFYADDHCAPAFLVCPDGKYMAFYAAHFGDTTSYERTYSGGAWGPEQAFNWAQRRPGGANFQTTYSNLFFLSSEGRTYNFVRGNNKSPNFMYSTDMGETWSYGGQLTASGDVGYNNGYYKYWSNGIDRIDFLFTEYHPRDFPTSVYHGYIMGGKSYATDGTTADDNIFDTLNVPTFSRFIKVFADSTIVLGVAMRRCWIADLQRYPDGSIAAIITARANDNQGGASTTINPDHRFLYCRFDGTRWVASYLGRAGLKLYASEQDYTGLGALCPDDPKTIYLSSTYDPRTDSPLGVHEIFKGVTADSGRTWTWTPVTQNSTRDNLRPVVPAWGGGNRALLWWRGTYSSAQMFDAAVVGILDRPSEPVGSMTYADATQDNTTLSDGSPLAATGPDTGAGAADNTWHIRTGAGNGGTVLSSSETGGEDAPVIRTQVTVQGPGTYDVWVNFWGNPAAGADWRIKAGFSTGGMQLFRQMACKEADAGDYAAPPVLSGPNNTFLYQAYVGRAQVSAEGILRVFVDDDAVRTGTAGTLTGNTVRTWYDGVSYAPVNRPTGTPAAAGLPPGYRLSRNYPNPFNPSTNIEFTLPAAGRVSMVVYDVLGNRVATLAGGLFGPGSHTVTWDADRMASGVYYAILSAQDESGSVRYRAVNALLHIK